MSKKIRILHVGKFYSPYSGGMESVVKDLCEGLQDYQRNFEIEVLCSHTQLKSEESSISGIRIHRMGSLGVLFGQSLMPSLFWKLPFWAKNYDLIHIHSPNPLVELVSLFLPKRIPLVCTYHADVIRQKILKPFYKPLIRLFLKRVRKIYVATQNHIDYSEVLPEFSDKCEIIPFGIEPVDLRETLLDQSQTQPFGDYALFIGRLVSYKGLDILLKAMIDLTSELVIVGEGPERENLEQIVKDNKALSGRIHFLGKVKDPILFNSLLAYCQFLVLPSVSSAENFGIVQLEAMGFKKAVVTTKLKSGVPCVGVDQSTCLLVEPGDVKGLSNAMKTLFEDREKSKAMGQKGYERFLDKYSRQKMSLSFGKSYKNLIKCENDSL